MTDSTRGQKQKALKEDVKHLLKGLLEAEKEDALCKIFTKESMMRMQKILCYSKEDLKHLSCIEDNGTVLRLEKCEIGDIHMLVNYQQCLIANGLFPKDITTFRFNSTTTNDWKSFVDHPDSVALISLTGDITVQISCNSRLDSSKPSKSASEKAQSTLLKPSTPLEVTHMPMNSLFYKITGSSPIINGEGCSHETYAVDSTSSKSPSTRNKRSDFDCKASDKGPSNELHSFLPTSNGTPSLLDGENRDIPFDEVDIDRSFERSLASSDIVGRSSAATPNSNTHYHQAYDLSSNLSTANNKIRHYSPKLEIPSSARATSSSVLQDLQDPHPIRFESHSSDFEHEESPKIKLNLEAFENHVLTEISNLRDDFSCSSYSSSASCTSESAEFPSCRWIKHINSDEILNFDFKDQVLRSHPSMTSKHKDPRLKSSAEATAKPIFDYSLVEPLPQLDMKPQFVEEKWKPQANHLPLKKRLIYRVENKGSSDIQ